MSEIVIAAAGNTLAPALAVLIERGFDVVRLDSDPELLEARKAGYRLVGEDPLILLGLVALVEARGANWQPSDKEVDALLAL